MKEVLPIDYVLFFKTGLLFAQSSTENRGAEQLSQEETKFIEALNEVGLSIFLVASLQFWLSMVLTVKFLMVFI